MSLWCSISSSVIFLWFGSEAVTNHEPVKACTSEASKELSAGCLENTTFGQRTFFPRTIPRARIIEALRAGPHVLSADLAKGAVVQSNGQINETTATWRFSSKAKRSMLDVSAITPKTRPLNASPVYDSAAHESPSKTGADTNGSQTKESVKGSSANGYAAEQQPDREKEKCPADGTISTEPNKFNNCKCDSDKHYFCFDEGTVNDMQEKASEASPQTSATIMKITKEDQKGKGAGCPMASEDAANKQGKSVSEFSFEAGCVYCKCKLVPSKEGDRSIAMLTTPFGKAAWSLIATLAWFFNT